MSGMQVPEGASDSSAVVLAPPQQQQQRQEVTGTQLSPEAADEIITSEIVLTPPQQQQQGQEVTVTQFSPEAVYEIIRRYKSFPKSETDELDETRGWLMVLATLTASITYSAALNPPGGAWQADDAANGYVAGDPVFRDKRPFQYILFYICNFISFATSLFILAVLSTPKVFDMSKMKLCNWLLVSDIISLMAALTFGSARSTMDYACQGIFLVFVFVTIIGAKIIERLKQNA